MLALGQRLSLLKALKKMVQCTFKKRLSVGQQLLLYNKILLLLQFKNCVPYTMPNSSRWITHVKHSPNFQVQHSSTHHQSLKSLVSQEPKAKQQPPTSSSTSYVTQ